MEFLVWEMRKSGVRFGIHNFALARAACGLRRRPRAAALLHNFPSLVATSPRLSRKGENQEAVNITRLCEVQYTYEQLETSDYCCIGTFLVRLAPFFLRSPLDSPNKRGSKFFSTRNIEEIVLIILYCGPIYCNPIAF